MSNAEGEYILLSASVTAPLTPEEEQTIQNWLKTESGMSYAELQITVDDLG